MIDLDNRHIRKIVKRRLSVIRQSIKESHGNCLTVSELDGLFKEVRGSYKKSIATRYDEIHKQTSLASLHIISCSSLASAIFDEDENIGYLFPQKWLSENTNVNSKRANPNRIISNLILALTKTSTSIVYLCESGFDNQARMLGRNLAELSWQILIITFFKEKLLLYISPDNEKEANEAWFKLFGKGKTGKDLKEIEKQLAFPETILSETKELRESIFRFYSMSLHNSYGAIAVQNYSWNLDDDTAEFCNFAGKSQTSIATLQYLNDILWYFHRVFYSIVFNYHKLLPIEPKRKMWMQARVLHDCTNECYLETLKKS